MPSAKDHAPDGEVVEVPLEALPTATLHAVIEEFITRAGTDYGTHEKTLEQKVADVLRQLQRGEAKIVFDLPSNSVNIVAAQRTAGSDRHRP